MPSAINILVMETRDCIGGDLSLWGESGSWADKGIGFHFHVVKKLGLAGELVFPRLVSLKRL